MEFVGAKQNRARFVEQHSSLVGIVAGLVCCAVYCWLWGYTSAGRLEEPGPVLQDLGSVENR
jgi:hypothetical protein